MCARKSEQSLTRFQSLNLLFSIFLMPVLLCSCDTNNGDRIITYTIDRSDLVESIHVQGTIQAVVTTPVLPPRGLFGQATVVKLAADGSFVRKGDTICVLSVPDYVSRYQSMLTQLETSEAALKKTEAESRLNIALLEAQLATSEARLKISSLDSLRLNYATGAQRRLMELEMQKDLIEKEKTEKKLASSKKIGETEIRQAKARIAQQKISAQSLNDQISSLTIIAQRDGIVMRTESPVFMIMGPTGEGSMGGPIREGSVLFLDNPVLQFPDLSAMQVSAEVQESYYRQIEKGQKVLITIDAANNLITTGRVNRKSIMGRTVQSYSQSKVKFYEIIIDIDSCHSKLTPGLSADCAVTLKAAMDTIFVPTLAIFERDSVSVVYVMEKGVFIPAKVETGTSGSSFTIITGGLKGDEIIALSEPPYNLIKQK